MFDLDTVGVSTKHEIWTMKDRLKYMYYKVLLRRDFTFMEKGIFSNRDYIIGGNLVHEENTLRLKNPSLVIGTDKQELMEFMGRKREHCLMNVRNFVKLAIAITCLHALLVRIPYSFETWFGDEAKVTLPKMPKDFQESILQKQDVQEPQKVEK